MGSNKICFLNDDVFSFEEIILQKIEKQRLIDEVKNLLSNCSIVLAVRQNGISVAESCALRSSITAINSHYKVIKNTLMNIALQGTEFESLNQSLSGQTAIAFSNSPAEISKIICEFIKNNSEKLEVVAGFYNGNLLSASEIKVLASLPSLDVLRAQFIALIKTPSQKVYSCIKAPGGQLARVINAYSEK